jgi:hypothetical protein
MKKIYLLLVLATAFTSVMYAQPRFGVNGGIVFANMRFEEDGDSETLDSKAGLTIGARVAVPVTDNISFRPGLNFIQKGGKEKSSFFGVEYEVSVNLNYLELPLNFVYSMDAGIGKFFAGAGPAISYALSGKIKTKVDGDEEEEKIEFGSGDEELKRFEFSGNILVGYELANGLYIQTNYSLGLSNLTNVSDSKAKNKYFGIRLGYFFGGSKSY